MAKRSLTRLIHNDVIANRFGCIISFLMLWYCHSPTQRKLFCKALSGDPESWLSVCNHILTQLDEIWKTTSIFLKMEDDLFFSSNWRQPQFYSRQPRKLIFAKQHCLNPTRWDMEDDHNFFLTEDDLFILENYRQPQLFWNRRPLQFVLKMQDDINFSV
jgi:hypothetical protein